MKSNKLMNMNNYKLSNNLIIFCFTGLLLPTNNSYAVDMGILQEQCAEIGFKMNTPENGKCVLKLMKSVASQQAKEAAKQRAYEQEQQYKREAEARAIELNNQELERQQIQALRQQQLARQQQEQGRAAALLQILNAGIQGYNEGREQSVPSYQLPMQLEPSIRSIAPIECQTNISSSGRYADTTCK
jgi:uncharacterized protein YaiL (DUF2058 family)